MAMFYYPKWLSDVRSHILEMARVWLVILGLKMGLWNIPNTVFAELNDRFVEAGTALKEARASPRTEVLNTRVRVAFEKLAACMRDIKARYFKKPPQSAAELLYCARTRRDSHDFDFDGESGNRSVMRDTARIFSKIKEVYKKS